MQTWMEVPSASMRSLTAINSTLTDNTAVNNGGAIQGNNTSPIELIHCTITGNSASSGGGVSSKFSVSLQNTILAANHAGKLLEGRLQPLFRNGHQFGREPDREKHFDRDGVPRRRGAGRGRRIPAG